MEEKDIAIDEANYILMEKYIITVFELCETSPLGNISAGDVLVS